jgi:hypothetical protein
LRYDAVVRPQRIIQTALLISLIPACVDDPDLAVDEQPLGGATDCSVAGAYPDDGLDDRAAIQTALTTKGCALLGPGVYDIGTPLPRLAGANRFDMLSLATGRSLRGTGPSTVLRFSGDAGAGDWHGIGVVGNEVEVSSLSLDTTQLLNTQEQTHVIHILGPALRVRVANNWFNHPSKPQWRSGDCIKVVGYDPTATADRRVSFEIHGNVFTLCDRSGVAIHSGVSSGVITGNLFLGTGDQDLDLEGGGGVIDDLVVNGNVFQRSLNTGLSVAIGADHTRRASFMGNVIHGGGMNTYNVDYLTVVGNAFEVPGAALDMVKSTTAVTISGNVFNQTDPAATIALIKGSHHNSGSPGSVVFSNNVVKAVNATGSLVNIISAFDVTVSNNSFTWSPPTVPTGTSTLSTIYGIIKLTDSIIFANNVVRGPWSRVLTVSNSYEATYGGGIRAVTFSGNVMRGPLAGLFCSQSGPGPLVSFGNSGVPASNCVGVTSGN